MYYFGSPNNCCQDPPLFTKTTKIIHNGKQYGNSFSYDLDRGTHIFLINYKADNNPPS